MYILTWAYIHWHHSQADLIWPVSLRYLKIQSSYKIDASLTEQRLSRFSSNYEKKILKYCNNLIFCFYMYTGCGG